MPAVDPVTSAVFPISFRSTLPPARSVFFDSQPGRTVPKQAEVGEVILVPARLHWAVRGHKLSNTRFVPRRTGRHQSSRGRSQLQNLFTGRTEKRTSWATTGVFITFRI